MYSNLAQLKQIYYSLKLVNVTAISFWNGCFQGVLGAVRFFIDLCFNYVPHVVVKGTAGWARWWPQIWRPVIKQVVMKPNLDLLGLVFGRWVLLEDIVSSCYYIISIGHHHQVQSRECTYQRSSYPLTKEMGMHNIPFLAYNSWNYNWLWCTWRWKVYQSRKLLLFVSKPLNDFLSGTKWFEDGRLSILFPAYVYVGRNMFTTQWLVMIWSKSRIG